MIQPAVSLRPQPFSHYGYRPQYEFDKSHVRNLRMSEELRDEMASMAQKSKWWFCRLSIHHGE